MHLYQETRGLKGSDNKFAGQEEGLQNREDILLVCSSDSRLPVTYAGPSRSVQCGSTTEIRSWLGLWLDVDSVRVLSFPMAYHLCVLIPHAASVPRVMLVVIRQSVVGKKRYAGVAVHGDGLSVHLQETLCCERAAVVSMGNGQRLARRRTGMLPAKHLIRHSRKCGSFTTFLQCR